MTLASFSPDQQRRLALFGVSEADLVSLDALGAFARASLPTLLPAWNAGFTAWPEIQAALAIPAVNEARVAHWVRVVSGDYGEAFMDSAKRLASAFYENGVPGYAVAICHATVVDNVCRERASRGGLFGRGAAAQDSALRALLNKVAWFDLEVLLETYAEAERASKTRAMRAMADAFEGQVLSIVETVGGSTRQMDGAVGSLAQAATRSTEASTSVAAVAQEAASSVRTVADAADQLEVSIREISEQVTQSRTIAEDAVQQSKGMSGTIGSLAQAVAQIGTVVSLISNIAEQTNLLALNATIEAARAGEAGRGFAVVASEVKALAGQTAKATEEISGQISGLQGMAAESVRALDAVCLTIDRISTTSVTISAAVEEQSAATREIARNCGEVASGNGEVSRLIQGVHHDSAGTAEAARLVTDATGDLGRQTAELQGAVGRFLAQVRAA